MRVELVFFFSVAATGVWFGLVRVGLGWDLGLGGIQVGWGLRAFHHMPLRTPLTSRGSLK